MQKTLKYLSQTLVKDVGGIEAASDLTRLSSSRIQQCISDHHEDAFLPVDVIAELEAQSKSRLFANFFQRQTEGEEPLRNDNRMILDFSMLAGHFGKVMEDYAEALEDDDAISAEEAKVLIRSALELQKKIIEIESKLLKLVSKTA